MDKSKKSTEKVFSSESIKLEDIENPPISAVDYAMEHIYLGKGLNNIQIGLIQNLINGNKDAAKRAVLPAYKKMLRAESQSSNVSLTEQRITGLLKGYEGSLPEEHIIEVNPKKVNQALDERRGIIFFFDELYLRLKYNDIQTHIDKIIYSGELNTEAPEESIRYVSNFVDARQGRLKSDIISSIKQRNPKITEPENIAEEYLELIINMPGTRLVSQMFLTPLKQLQEVIGVRYVPERLQRDYNKVVERLENIEAGEINPSRMVITHDHDPNFMNPKLSYPFDISHKKSNHSCSKKVHILPEVDHYHNMEETLSRIIKKFSL